MSIDAVQTAPSIQETAAQCRAAAMSDLQTLDRLTSQINVYDTQSILTFGASAAQEIAAYADTVLTGIRKNQAGDAGPLLTALGRIMEKFDMGELQTKEKKGFFSFGKAPQNQDQILDKYRDMGQEVDRVYIALKQYEAEVQSYNRSLQELCNANIRLYQNLARYIAAGEQGVAEIQAHLQKLESALAQAPGDTALQMDRDSVQPAGGRVERRGQDLKPA